MSFFTTETICMDCSASELAIRRELREAGINDLRYESCGYIPNPKELIKA
jgi:hypothetical protein